MSIDVYWCLLMFIDVYWCLLMFIDVYWCLLMFIDVYWCLLMFIDVYWCLLMFVDVCWCLLLVSSCMLVAWCWLPWYHGCYFCYTSVFHPLKKCLVSLLFTLVGSTIVKYPGNESSIITTGRGDRYDYATWYNYMTLIPTYRRPANDSKTTFLLAFLKVYIHWGDGVLLYTCMYAYVCMYIYIYMCIDVCN